MSAYLRKRHFALDTVLNTTRERLAIGVHDIRNGSRTILALESANGLIRPLGKPLPLAKYEPYPQVQWFSFGGTIADGLSIAFDAGSEGIVGARIFQVRGNTLHLTYQDANATCKPATIMIVRGKVLLRFNTNNIKQSDCEAECSVLIREEIGIEPAWSAVLEWRKGEWRSTSEPLRDIYAPLARAYQRAAEFVSTTKAGSCTRDATTLRRAFTTWAARAAARSR